MRHISCSIITGALLVQFICCPAAQEPKRLKKIDPTKMTDIAQVAHELFIMQECIKAGYYDSVARDYKVYIPHTTELRFSHRMRISLKKSIDAPHALRILKFKRSPRWTAKENYYDHTYQCAAIELNQKDNQYTLVQPLFEEKKDLILLLTALFNNEIPGITDQIDISGWPQRPKRKPCILM